MTKWAIYPHANDLQSGSEIDFCEERKAEELAPALLAVGDELIFEWPDNHLSNGSVIAAAGKNIIHRERRDPDAELEASS